MSVCLPFLLVVLLEINLLSTQGRALCMTLWTIRTACTSQLNSCMALRLPVILFDALALAAVGSPQVSALPCAVQHLHQLNPIHPTLSPYPLVAQVGGRCWQHGCVPAD